MKLSEHLQQPLIENNPWLMGLKAGSRGRLRFTLGLTGMVGLLALTQALLRNGGWELGLWFVLLNTGTHGLAALICLEIAFHPRFQRIDFIRNRTWGKFYLTSFLIFLLGNSLFLLVMQQAAARVDSLAPFQHAGMQPWKVMSHVKVLPFGIFFTLLYKVLFSQVPPLQPPSPRTLTLDVGKRQMVLKPEELRYAACEEHYLRLYLHRPQEAELLIKMKLSELMLQLPEGEFSQIHRSYLINFAEIRAWSREGEGWQALLRDGTSLPVSRRRWALVQTAWNRFQNLGI